MHWYILALRRFIGFSARSTRREYWYFQIVNTLVLAAVVTYEKAAGNLEAGGTPWLAKIYFVAILLPSLSLSVRRLHDTERRSWWVVVSAMPVIGVGILWILAALPGTPQGNRFLRAPADCVRVGTCK